MHILQRFKIIRNGPILILVLALLGLFLVYNEQKPSFQAWAADHSVNNPSGKNNLGVKPEENLTNKVPEVKKDIRKPEKLGDQQLSKPNFEDKNNTRDAVEQLQFYISEITHFYEMIVTVLLAVIAGLLVLGFLYIQYTTKKQIEDSANEALETKSFQICLNDLVNKKFAEFKNSEEVVGLYPLMDALDDRIKNLEELKTEQSYEIQEKPEA